MQSSGYTSSGKPRLRANSRERKMKRASAAAIVGGANGSNALRIGKFISSWILFPLVLCWPMLLYMLSKSPSTQNDIKQEAKLLKNYVTTMEHKTFTKANQLRGHFKNYIQASANEFWQHHEWMGYGAHLPRVAVVIVGKNVDALLRSAESVFRSTDRNRILVVVVVLDGITKDTLIETKFTDIDNGKTHHFHGPFSKTNNDEQGSTNNSINHSKKIHLIFNPDKQGVASCRQSAVDFITIYNKEMTNQGLMEPDEDIILLLLRSDATLEYPGWLDPVTGALIVPPQQQQPSSETEETDPQEDNKTNPPPLAANAVSLAVDYIDSDADGNVGGAPVTPGTKIVRSAPGSYMGFGWNLQFEWKKLSHENAMYLQSYPTPVVLGPATAMRLSVYQHLPARDSIELQSQFAADMELSFNLWLCADGLDVLPTARVVVNPSYLPGEEEQITQKEASRLIAAWMPQSDPRYTSKVLDAIGGNDNTNKDSLQRMVDRALQTQTLPLNLEFKCRTFQWYAEHVNRDVFLPGAGSASDFTADTEREKIQQPHPDTAARSHNSEKEPTASKSYLTEDQLTIIGSAKAQSIVFEDLTKGHTPGEHPHAGGRDEHGNDGYVHDATALRFNPPTFVMPLPKEETCKHDNHYKMLTEKVKVNFDADAQAEASGKPRAKIFCIAYTIEKYHDKLSALRETWAPKCDGFMIASTKTDKSLNTVEIPHEGEEIYNNIWQKIRSVWSYVYDNYYQEYDWFHIGGDDLYVIVENLRLYLDSDEIRSAANGGKEPLTSWDASPYQTPLFLGRRFAEQGNMERIFNSGGSGYTINKAALKALVRSFATCMPHLKTFAEDVMVAQCFRKQGIFPFPTRDKEGGERYMPFLPGHHYGYRPPVDKNSDWYPKYAVEPLKVGVDHCATYSVAFHYAKPKEMRRIHSILYGYCDKEDIL